MMRHTPAVAVSRHTRARSLTGVVAALVAGLVALSACSSSAGHAGGSGRKQIVVTTPVLGAIVRDLAGGVADVTVLMPNGADPHDWEPSAKDIERLGHADVVVENGLGLEGGVQRALQQAREAHVRVLTASDHVDIRHVGAGEGTDPSDADQAAGAEDPHIWMDPVGMAAVVRALGPELAQAGIDVGARTEQVAAALESLDRQVASILATVPQAERKLVTGHESLGYFARRYGFQLIGAFIPSVSSQAEATASDIAALRQKIEAAHVPAIFTELGTPADVVAEIAKETGARSITLVTHALPADGTYATFLLDIAHAIAGGLGGSAS